MKRLVLGVVASCAVLLAGISVVQSQVVIPDDQLFIPTGYENFVWTAGDGTWQTANWDFWLQPADAGNDTGGLYFQDLGGPYSDVGRPGGGDSEIFYNNTGSAMTIGLAADIFDANSGIQFIVENGPFAFNLNGFTIGTRAFVFGDGPGNAAASVNFDGAGTVKIAALTLGADGASNNVWGGANSTITFTGGSAYAFDSGITVTVGSAGGTGNVFHVGAGDSYNLVSLTVNGSGTGTGTNNRVEVLDGGSLTVAGATQATADVGNTGLSNAGIILNGGDMIVTGSSVTTTGAFVANSGSTVTVDGSSLSAYNFFVAGNMTITNGSQVQGTKTDESTVNGANGGVSGTLTITNGGQYFDSSPSLTTDGHNTPIYFSLASGGKIDVSNGGSFDTSSSFAVTGTSGTATISVDDQAGSSFFVTGNMALNQNVELALQGNGAVQVGGSLGVGASGVNDVMVDTGSTTLNVGNLAWNTGTSSADSYSGVHGTVHVAHGISLSGQATHAVIGSGTTVLMNGNVQLSASGTNQIWVNTGGTVGGAGVVTSAGGTSSAGFSLNGGTLQVGDWTQAGAGTLAFNQTLSQLATSIFAFRLFSDGTNLSNDMLELSTPLSQFHDILSLTLSDLPANFKAGDTFTLFADLSGTGTGQNDTFTLDAATASTLAADGLAVDLSQVGTNGSITIDAVPEPSTWAMLFLGLGGLIWRVRRRAARA